MPEGDTLYRIAHNLRPALVGQVLVDAQSPFKSSTQPGIKSGSESPPTRMPTIDAQALIGKRVASVEATGKHLMIGIDDHRVIHSHLGMTGSWHCYTLDQKWNKPLSQAALVLKTAEHVVINFSPKLLELVSETRLRRNEYLNRLGPDLMLPEVDFATLLARFRTHDISPIGEAVMNQTLAAGIGNVYKSESLFLAKINPWTRVGQIDDVQLIAYLKQTHKLMRQNRTGGMRTTRQALDGGRMWVYGRHGERCLKCSTTIQMRRQGDQGRSTYWCPGCQA